MAYTVNRLCSAIGAEVIGVEAAAINDDVFDELRAIWIAHDGLLVLRDQHLTPEAHVAFSRHFGDLLPHGLAKFELPGFPEIFHFHVPVEEQIVATNTLQSGSAWHAAHTYEKDLSGASICHVIEMPPVGGDMFFANMYAAYEALSEPIKGLLDQLRAVHQHPGAANKEGEPRASAEHPVVYVHPESRRKALLISPAFTTDLIGLTADESEALIEFLCRHCTRPEFTYRHHWRINDLMVSDDRCSLHYNISGYSGDGAVTMNRTSAVAAVA